MNLAEELKNIQKSGHQIGELSILQGSSQRGPYNGLSIHNTDQSRRLEIRILGRDKTIEIFFFNTKEELSFALDQFAKGKGIKLPKSLMTYAKTSDFIKTLDDLDAFITKHLASIWEGDKWYEVPDSIVEDEIKSRYF